MRKQSLHHEISGWRLRVRQALPKSGISMAAQIQNAHLVQLSADARIERGAVVIGGTVARKTALTIGAGSTVGHFAHVSARRASVNMGTRVTLAHGVWIGGTERITLDNGAMIGPYSVIVSSNHYKTAEGSWHMESECGRPINIGENAWIGAHVVVLPGVTIGAGAVIGAGVIVAGDVSPGAKIRGDRFGS